MKHFKCFLVIGVLLIAGAATTHAQFTLVSANLRPVGMFIPNASTNHKHPTMVFSQ